MGGHTSSYKPGRSGESAQTTELENLAHGHPPVSHNAPGIKPPHIREFTLRAVLASLVVALLMGASYPYIVLKLGFGPNVSVVSAFFGYLALGLVFRDYNRWENNIVQTAGTSAAQTAFMCVLLAAFDMLAMTPGLGFNMSISPLQSFAWLTTAGLLGVLLAVPMRQHFIVDEKLTYADGVAAAETLVVLDARGPAARKAARSLGLGTLSSAAVMLGQFFKRLPEVLPFGARGEVLGVGVGFSLLSLGSGMLVGMRINASMLMGSLISWVLAPELLFRYGVVTEVTKSNVLRWVMWPATGMLVAGGLTALFLKWRLLVKTFQHLTAGSVRSEEFPMKWVGIGVAITTVSLMLVQNYSLGMPFWMTFVAVLFSLPLMLVGLRVLGETNWGPISALSNMMQGIFGLLAPGHIGANMASSGTTGMIATESEALMQDYKAGYIIGSSPRYLTYAQLIAVPIGAAAVSFMYPLLKATYGIGGENGLSSPISQKWASFAELLSKGLSALPRGAVTAMIIFTLVGILLTVMEEKWKEWTPSPTGIGIGMLVPGVYIVTMFLGGILETLWRKADPVGAGQHVTPLASGLIAGEAIVAVIVPLLILAGIVSL